MDWVLSVHLETWWSVNVNIEIQHLHPIAGYNTCKLQIKIFHRCVGNLARVKNVNVEVTKWWRCFFCFFFFRREIGPEFFPRCLLVETSSETTTNANSPLLNSTNPPEKNFARQFATISILGSTHQISILKKQQHGFLYTTTFNHGEFKVYTPPMPPFLPPPPRNNAPKYDHIKGNQWLIVP